MWAVEVTYEDDDPGTYGPYTQAQAERVAKRLTEEIALSYSSHGHNHHPHDVRFASAAPLGRYDQFMTAEEKRAARKAVRESDSRVPDYDDFDINQENS